MDLFFPSFSKIQKIRHFVLFFLYTYKFTRKVQLKKQHEIVKFESFLDEKKTVENDRENQFERYRVYSTGFLTIVATSLGRAYLKCPMPWMSDMPLPPSHSALRLV